MTELVFTLRDLSIFGNIFLGYILRSGLLGREHFMMVNRLLNHFPMDLYRFAIPPCMKLPNSAIASLPILHICLNLAGLMTCELLLLGHVLCGSVVLTTLLP